MKRLLHTGQQITDPNLKVLVTTYSDNGFKEYRDTCRYCRNNLTYTWGYSAPTTIYGGVTTNVSTYGYVFADTIMQSYWCFSNELDVTQFMLIAPPTARAHIWPSKTVFTIYEFVDSTN